MNSNIKCCCRQCFTPNERFYVEIRNECPEYLHVTLFYTFWGKEITKPGLPFGPGKIERIAFPSDAMAIFFQVFRTAFRPPASVCTKSIPNNRISRFTVKQVQGGAFVCLEV